jgi:hypothetical protein
MAPASAAQRSSPVTVSTPWRVVYQNRSGLPSLVGVTAVSAHNIWAVGNRRAGTFAAHWDGRRWLTSGIPHPAGFVAQSVQADSHGGIWVLGFVADSAHSAVIARNGTAWHTIMLPSGAGTSGVIFGPSDMWLDGNVSACNNSGQCTSTVMHWNGRTWTTFTVPTLTSDLEGTSDGNLWLTGADNIRQVSGQEFGALVAYRWNGTSWRPVPMPHPQILIGSSITPASPNNVWISAFSAASGEPALAVHWNGQRWTVLTAPAILDIPATEAVTDGRGGAWFTPAARWNNGTWYDYVGLWLPGWANPYSYVGMSRIPGTTVALVVIVSQGGTLIGASQRLPSLTLTFCLVSTLFARGVSARRGEGSRPRSLVGFQNGA